MSDDLLRVRGIGPVAAERLFKAGVGSIEQVAESRPEELAFVKGIGVVSAQSIIENAKHLITLEKGLTIVLDHVKNQFSKSCPKCGAEMKKKYIILGPENRIQANQCTVCKFYMPV